MSTHSGWSPESRPALSTCSSLSAISRRCIQDQHLLQLSASPSASLWLSSGDVEILCSIFWIGSTSLQDTSPCPSELIVYLCPWLQIWFVEYSPVWHYAPLDSHHLTCLSCCPPVSLTSGKTNWKLHYSSHSLGFPPLTSTRLQIPESHPPFPCYLFSWFSLPQIINYSLLCCNAIVQRLLIARMVEAELLDSHLDTILVKSNPCLHTLFCIWVHVLSFRPPGHDTIRHFYGNIYIYIYFA